MSDWITETLQPNGTLKNKLSIENDQELRQKEYELSSINSIIFSIYHSWTNFNSLFAIST